jgi:hypothetical protein
MFQKYFNDVLSFNKIKKLDTDHKESLESI